MHTQCVHCIVCKTCNVCCVAEDLEKPKPGMADSELGLDSIRAAHVLQLPDADQHITYHAV